MGILHDIGKYFLMIKLSFSKTCKREVLYKQVFKEIGKNKNSSKTEIENIPLQKWNFVSINVHNNYCDVFFNDELNIN